MVKVLKLYFLHTFNIVLIHIKILVVFASSRIFIYIYIYIYVITSRKISIKINSKAIVEMKCDTEQMMKLE